jgi:hypothetical protein
MSDSPQENDKRPIEPDGSDFFELLEILTALKQRALLNANRTAGFPFAPMLSDPLPGEDGTEPER